MELRIGAIVEVRANDRLRPADQTIAKLAENGIYRTARHLEMAYSRPTPGRSPPAVVEAHERRLEALRRAGIVERIEAGVWRVPADLPQEVSSMTFGAKEALTSKSSQRCPSNSK